MSQQTNTAATADETVRQRLDTVRNDPTAAFRIGTDTETDRNTILTNTLNEVCEV
jgi:hypothetical protein